MRLLTCIYRERRLLGIVEDQQVLLPALAETGSALGDDCGWLVEGGAPAMQAFRTALAAAGDGCRVALADVRLLAPIPRPRQNVICLGWNYVEHIAEASAVAGPELPEHPVVFTKSVYSVIGHDQDIPVSAHATSQLDWESELAVVIGTEAWRVTPDQALAHVFGYTIVNDISARDLQFRHKQFFIGKSVTGGCPMGPWLVTADEIPDPQALAIGSRVNGVSKQDSSTSFMIFDVAHTISILSQSMRLYPGDVIATGTPSGVGFARKPPEFLAPGDVVECEVEGVGVLRNRIVAGP